MYVTENGISERGAVNLNDMHRTHYYKNYINQALKGTVSSTKTYNRVPSLCMLLLSCTLGHRVLHAGEEQQVQPCLQPAAKVNTVVNIPMSLHRNEAVSESNIVVRTLEVFFL